ncbi:MAG: penicillin-binding protein 2, partial [Pseudomonadota bacterium]
MRYKFILVVFIAFWGVMLIRLYHVSIKSNFYYEKLARDNIERKQFIKPIRGEVTDSRGKLLAMNQIGFSLSIIPHLKPQSPELQTLIDTLVETFPDLNKTVMLKVYQKENSPYNHKHIKVVDFIHYEDMIGAYPKLSLIENLKIDAETKRYYP